MLANVCLVYSEIIHLDASAILAGMRGRPKHVVHWLHSTRSEPPLANIGAHAVMRDKVEGGRIPWGKH